MTQDVAPRAWDANYAALLSASILRNQLVNGFQLAKMRLANLRSVFRRRWARLCQRESFGWQAKRTP